MFSLIITIISIALVAALALATIYYGGQKFMEASGVEELSQALLSTVTLRFNPKQLLQNQGLFARELDNLINNGIDLMGISFNTDYAPPEILKNLPEGYAIDKKGIEWRFKGL